MGKGREGKGREGKERVGKGRGGEGRGGEGRGSIFISYLSVSPSRLYESDSFLI